MNDAFVKLHPFSGIIYFAAVIGFSMLFMNPVCILISLSCAILNAALINGKKALAFTARFIFPMITAVVIINPVFNHRGATIITYLPWNNPLTLESVLYGAASAVMISTVALWFSCVNRVITSDKVVYLFGRITPSLSLVLSMALRFIPCFTAQFKQTREAQATFSINGRQTLTGRFKAAVGVFSVMVSRSMENAVETSDSMKSRGYGLKGRTAFSPFRFYKQDAAVLAVVLTESGALLALLLCGKLPFRYFPSVHGELTDGFAILYYCLYAALLLTPLFILLGEGIKWKRLQSNI